mmetsp:Transcript_8759/g.19874  ORF Transcript_8759/g.19874 Transcript_8759/m.19874 type:complete len:209 (-) Transcript_8759:1266-1892(-)
MILLLSKRNSPTSNSKSCSRTLSLSSSIWTVKGGVPCVRLTIMPAASPLHRCLHTRGERDALGVPRMRMGIERSFLLQVFTSPASFCHSLETLVTTWFPSGKKPLLTLAPQCFDSSPPLSCRDRSWMLEMVQGRGSVPFLLTSSVTVHGGLPESSSQGAAAPSHSPRALDLTALRDSTAGRRNSTTLRVPWALPRQPLPSVKVSSAIL